jgi:anionic cell wall polymer biosynthesis LytR-Cps2A-Psr (LCP) family protein
VIATAGIALFAADNDSPGADPAPQPTDAGGDSVVSTLIVGTRETGGSAVWLTLLAYDTDQKAGAVVYIPAHSAVEVPGRGLQGVGDSLISGGVPLLLVSAENLLGISIDRYIELSDRDARTLFAATGPISVDVPEEVRVSAGKDRARLTFDDVLQRLGAPFLVELLYTRGLDADDVELGSRHIAFWDGLFTAFAEDPENLAAAVRAAGGALVESDAEAGEHAQLFSALASLESTSRTLTTLPVQQVSVGGSELYSVDPDAVAALMGDLFSSVTAPSETVRVQVLNGNGVPGIGQEVAERLIGAGFRVVLTGNARRLNYAKTLVITYDSSPAGQALAERARRLIGVGEVQVSAQQQGIVDLTIVIGKDFLRTR